MKKLHILIPSLVATFSMPLIGLVGCNKAGCNKDYGTIYLNNVIKGSVGNMVALASNKLTMVKGGIFKFSINMGEWDNENYPTFIEFIDDNQHTEMVSFTILSFYVNDVEEPSIKDETWWPIDKNSAVNLNDEYCQELIASNAIVTGQVITNGKVNGFYFALDRL